MIHQELISRKCFILDSKRKSSKSETSQIWQPDLTLPPMGFY